MKKMIGALAISLAVLGGSFMIAEDKVPAPAAEKKASPEIADLEKKIGDYLSNHKWVKDDASQEKKDKSKADGKVYKQNMDKLFDLKLAELTDKAKAEEYKAKKTDIVKNNVDSGLKNKKSGFKWDFEAPVVDWGKKKKK